MAIGPVPPLVGNANSQVVDYALAAGYAIIFAAGLNSGSVQANEYHWGTHAQATYEQNTTRTIWKSAPGISSGRAIPPLLTTQPQVDQSPSYIKFKPINTGSAVQPPGVAGVEYVWGTHAQAIYEANTTRWSSTITLKQGFLVWNIFGEPQQDPNTIQGAVFPAPFKALTSGRVSPLIVAGSPQADPTQLPQALLFNATNIGGGPVSVAEYKFGLHAQWIYEQNTTRFIVKSNSQLKGPVPPLTAAGMPQADPTQIAPNVLTPLVAAFAPTPGPLASFFTTLPQFEERPTAVVWASLVSGTVTAIVPQWVTLPQWDDRPVSTVWPSLVAGARTPVIGFLATLPQFEERTTQAIYHPWDFQGIAVDRQLYAAPQLIDLSPQGFITQGNVLARGKVPALITAAPQLIDLTVQAVLSKVLVAPSQPLAIQILRAAPQLIDLTLQGFITPPQRAGTRPRVPPLVAGSPQIDLTPPSWIYAGARNNQATIVPKFIYASSQFIDLTQQGSIKGTPPGRQAKVPPLIVAAPQLIDLTPPGFLKPAAPTHTGFVYPLMQAAPQFYDWTLKTWFSAANANPNLVTYGYTMITVKAIAQLAEQGAEAVFIENSACEVEAQYYSIEGTPFIPVAVEYRVDAVIGIQNSQLVYQNIVPWTSIVPATVNTITVTSAENAMISKTRSWEKHQVMFQVTDGTGNIYYAKTIYKLKRVSGF